MRADFAHWLVEDAVDDGGLFGVAGSSARIMAALRNAAVATLRLAGPAAAASGRPWAVRNPVWPIAALHPK
jgi:hypothetical protein